MTKRQLENLTIIQTHGIDSHVSDINKLSDEDVGKCKFFQIKINFFNIKNT